jgi:hypothetical protein
MFAKLLENLEILVKKSSIVLAIIIIIIIHEHIKEG